MTTASLHHTPLTVSRRAEVRPLRFADVLAVEFRKLFATRANRLLVLLIVGSAIAVAAVVAVTYETIFDGEAYPWILSALFLRMPVHYLVAPLIVLLLTTEWGTRSAMTTFTLVPRRGLVVLAKGIVTAATTLVVWALTCGLGIASTYLGRRWAGMDTLGLWIPAREVAIDLLGFVLVMASAFAIGLLVQNSAAAIAVVLVAPLAVQVLRQLGQWMSETFAWIDMNGVAQELLMVGDPDQWLKLLVSSTVWVTLPLIAGLWWTGRREAS